MAKGDTKRQRLARSEEINRKLGELLSTDDPEEIQAVRKYVDSWWADARGSAYCLIHVLAEFKGNPTHSSLSNNTKGI